MNDLRDSAFALREAQRAYMADRGNEAKGKAVAAAAERLDAAIAAVDAGQAGRVHRMVAENDALRNAIGSRVDAALSAAQPEGGDALLSACYAAMQSAMRVIDPDEGEGDEHSRTLNALADCRVRIEEHNALRAGLTKNEYGRPIGPAPAQQAVTDELVERACATGVQKLMSLTDAETKRWRAYYNDDPDDLEIIVRAALTSTAAKAAEGVK